MNELKTDVKTELRSFIEERMNQNPAFVENFNWKDPFKPDNFDIAWQFLLMYGYSFLKKSIPLVAKKSRLLSGVLWILAEFINHLAKRYHIEQKSV